MITALKKLTAKSPPPPPPPGSASPQTLSTSLQKKFSRGVHYNLKLLIRGDRSTGKSTLFRRLQGGTFVEEYEATEEIQVAAIHWNHKATDDIVKVGRGIGHGPSSVGWVIV